MELTATVRALMADGKGILLAGESDEIENERLVAFGIGSDDAQREYHELLLTTPGIEEHLSGVILSPHATDAHVSDGTSFVQLLASKNILAGVSLPSTAVVDENFHTLLQQHASQGISFALFTASASVSADPMSDELQKNILALSAAAKVSHDVGMVPVLALDVAMYGAHSAAQAEDYILEMLSLLSDDLKAASVPLESIIIAVSMAVSGSDNPARADSSEVAERSVRALTTGIPPAVGGVVFLSDAQNPEEGTANLNALARLEPLPWPIAFCFARALQEPVLAIWKGNQENFAEAQSVFEGRLALLSRADGAGYSKTFEEA